MVPFVTIHRAVRLGDLEAVVGEEDGYTAEEVGTRVWHVEGGLVDDVTGSHEEYAASLV